MFEGISSAKAEKSLALISDEDAWSEVFNSASPHFKMLLILFGFYTVHFMSTI